MTRLAEWREVSDRYVPLAIIPYMSGIEVTVAEVQRAVQKGPSRHRDAGRAQPEPRRPETF